MPSDIIEAMRVRQPEEARPTYQDIIDLPAHLRGEIIAGELVAQPRPSAPHVQAASVLGGVLLTAFQLGRGGPGGWWIQHEPELSLGIDPDYDPVVPDLAGWRVERMTHIPSAAQYRVVPNWICEVLSPSTRRIDRIRKLPFYARAGIDHAWILDPTSRTLEVFRRSGPTWELASTADGSDVVRAEPFEALELALEDLWVPEAEPDA